MFEAYVASHTISSTFRTSCRSRIPFVLHKFLNLDVIQRSGVVDEPVWGQLVTLVGSINEVLLIKVVLVSFVD